MAQFGSQPFVTRPEIVRWSACAAVAVAAHVLAAFAVTARSDEADVEAGAPVVMIELAPLAAAPPAPAREFAAGPLMETESQERVAEGADPAPQKKSAKEQEIEAPPAPDPEAAVARAESPPEEGPIQATPVPQTVVAAPVPTAPQTAPTPAVEAAAPAVGAERPTPAAVASWQRLLLAQLERHKRYPPQAHGRVGEARLAFSIDRQGHVVASRIVHSSGSDALDEEALALIKRAQPLPPPPAGLPDDQLSFVLPIRYR